MPSRLIFRRALPPSLMLVPPAFHLHEVADRYEVGDDLTKASAGKPGRFLLARVVCYRELRGLQQLTSSFHNLSFCESVFL
jgi:hypothetical protein